MTGLGGNRRAGGGRHQAEYESELVAERVTARIAAAQQSVPASAGPSPSRLRSGRILSLLAGLEWRARPLPKRRPGSGGVEQRSAATSKVREFRPRTCP